MATLSITGTVTNAGGASSPFTGTLDLIEAPVIDGVTVVPQSAPAGTLRTITILAHDPGGLALTYACNVNGVPATQVSPGIFTIVV